MRKIKLPRNPYVAYQKKQIRLIEEKQKILKAVMLSKEGKNIEEIYQELMLN